MWWFRSSSRSPARARRSAPPTGVLVGLAAAALLVALSGAPGARAQTPSAAAPNPPKGPATQRLVLAHYYYSVQGDPRKPMPVRDMRDARGAIPFTNHPWESTGPWLSYDRAQWHRTQLQAMEAGGIDVALAVYRGGLADRRSYALRGLDVMAQALKELKAEAKAGPFSYPRSFPQIGMALDLGGLSDQAGGPVSLKDPAVQRSLYGMVRDFYLHVPEEFRATIQLPSGRRAAVALGPGSAGSGGAYPVRLIDDAAVRDADNSVLTQVEQLFAAEFGARLIWIGTPALRARMPALDAVAPFPAADQPTAVHYGAWLRVASLGPGFDPGGRGGAAGNGIRSRENGVQTVEDFRRALEAEPDWILIDSWNGYHRGSEVAPSLEYGLQYRDLIRAKLLEFKHLSDYSAHFLKAGVPRVMQTGQIYHVEVAVQNTGIYDWDDKGNISLSYRWYRDGEPVKDPGAATSAAGHPRGGTKTYLVGVTTPRQDSKPLPPGQYELEFNLFRPGRGEAVWFSAEDAVPFRVPVTVEDEAGRAGAGVFPSPLRPFWLASSMPVLTRRGATYPVTVRVRNDGSGAWRKGFVTLAYRWRKHASYLQGRPKGVDELDIVLCEGPRIPLPADLPPGRILTLETQVSTADAQGQALIQSSPRDDWAYVLEWYVREGDQEPAKQAATLREPIGVADRDPAPHFLGSTLNSNLVAGRVENITVGIRNSGPDTWKRDRDRIVVHWYYMDGSEALWNDSGLPLPEDVPPFSRVAVPLSKKAQLARFGGSPEPEMPEKKKRRERDGKKKNDREPEKTEIVVQDTVIRDVPVRVPYYFGPMYCVLDLQHEGLFASTSAATRGTDILVVPVNVFSPTFTPIPLTAYLNVDGISHDADRGDADIDGNRNSFPAELLPPYVARPSSQGLLAPSPMYPSGLWVRPLNDLEGSRACFMFPNKEPGTPNMVGCAGQRVAFPPLQRTAAHLMAVCTREDAQAEFTLLYADGTREARKLTFTHWNDPPKHGEKTAFMTSHRHTAQGDDPGTRCYLNQYTLPVDRAKLLVGIALPRQPAVKIVAVTLESATLRAR